MKIGDIVQIDDLGSSGNYGGTARITGFTESHYEVVEVVVLEDDPSGSGYQQGDLTYFSQDRVSPSSKSDPWAGVLGFADSDPGDETKPEPEPEPGQSEDFRFFEVLLDSAEDAHPGSKRFYNLLIEAGLLHAQKQRDYGRSEDPFANVRASEDFGIPGWVGCMVRANDKMRRLQTYAKTGALANEGVRDSLLDLAVYALIGLVLFEETTQE